MFVEYGACMFSPWTRRFPPGAPVSPVFMRLVIWNPPAVALEHGASPRAGVDPRGAVAPAALRFLELSWVTPVCVGVCYMFDAFTAYWWTGSSLQGFELLTLLCQFTAFSHCCCRFRNGFIFCFVFYSGRCNGRNFLPLLVNLICIM